MKKRVKDLTRDLEIIDRSLNKLRAQDEEFDVRCEELGKQLGDEIISKILDPSIKSIENEVDEYARRITEESTKMAIERTKIILLIKDLEERRSAILSEREFLVSQN